MNVTIPFQTKVGEMGVMYFEATDPKTGNVEHYVSCVHLENRETVAESTIVLRRQDG